MKRDFRKLEGDSFDVLVIGGGIYGAWTAYDAALRGLRVALVEQNDWAAGTSSSSSKLLHGGIRYLEHRDFGLVRKSLQERRFLWRAGPHRVQPLRFVLPVYRGARVGRLKLKLGFWLYDLLAGRDQPVAPHRGYSAPELLERYAMLDPQGLTGGFTYGDCQTDDARMTLEVVDGASNAGAVCVNRARARELLMEHGRVAGARIQDTETGQIVELRAGVTANCAGAWSEQLLEGRTKPLHRLSKGVHLLLPALPVEDAFLILSDDDRRVIFMIPWYGRTLLGTTDTDFDGDPTALRVESHEVRYLLDLANNVLRDVAWTEGDVIGSFAGLRTLMPNDKNSPSAATREFAVEEPRPGLITGVGGKYTSARIDAADIVRRFARTKRHPATDGPLPWKPSGDWTAWLEQSGERGRELGLEGEMLLSCQRRYGTTVDRLFDIIEAQPELARPITDDAPFCLGEILHAVEFEMARSLEDILRRRIPLTLVSRLDRGTFEQAGALAGERLGWSAERRQQEVDSMLAASSQHEPA